MRCYWQTKQYTLKNKKIHQHLQSGVINKCALQLVRKVKRANMDFYQERFDNNGHNTNVMERVIGILIDRKGIEGMRVYKTNCVDDTLESINLRETYGSPKQDVERFCE